MAAVAAGCDIEGHADEGGARGPEVVEPNEVDVFVDFMDGETVAHLVPKDAIVKDLKAKLLAWVRLFSRGGTMCAFLWVDVRDYVRDRALATMCETMCGLCAELCAGICTGLCGGLCAAEMNGEETNDEEMNPGYGRPYYGHPLFTLCRSYSAFIFRPPSPTITPVSFTNKK